MVSVELRELTKAYGDVAAVRDVSLEIGRGELFVLLGPSGCGKTTLLRLVAGLEEPTRGRIYFDGRDVTDLPTQRRNTALVPQTWALWPHMTVFENVAYGLKIRGLPRREIERRVKEALELVGLSGLERRRPYQLSGGQQQRVALARALVVEPAVLLLDEPLANLDAKIRAELRGEIRRLAKSLSTTTIYVTHDQEEAFFLADRLAVMQAGSLRQVGTPEEVYRRPKDLFVATFLGKAAALRGGVVDRSADGVVVDVGFPVKGAAVDEVGVGDEAVVVVRPASIRLDGRGGAPCKARDARFVGGEYVVELDCSGVALTAPSRRPLKPGEVVEVSVEGALVYRP